MNKSNDVQFAADLRNVIVRLIKKLRKESPTGQHLSLTERSTLALLYQHQSLLASELAVMEMITNQSMSQVLSRLFGLGYVTRVTSATDKRKVNISLTAKGMSILTEYRHQRDEWLAGAIAAACSPEEQVLLKKAIVPLSRLVEFK